MTTAARMVAPVTVLPCAHEPGVEPSFTVRRDRTIDPSGRVRRFAA